MIQYEEYLTVNSFEEMKNDLPALVATLRDKIIYRIKADGNDPANYQLTIYDEHLSNRIRMEAIIHSPLR